MTAAELRARIEAVREARASIVRTRVVGVPEFDRLVAQGIAIVAERALCDALLRAPAALEAVEALVMLGRARAQREGAVSVTDALDAIGQAESTVNKLADRLAADAKGGA